MMSVDGIENSRDAASAAGLRIVYTTAEILALGDRRWNAALDAAAKAVEEIAAFGPVTASADVVTWAPEAEMVGRSAVLAAIASLRRLSHDS